MYTGPNKLVQGIMARQIQHYESPAFGGYKDLTDREKELWTSGHNVGFGSGFKNGYHEKESQMSRNFGTACQGAKAILSLLDY